MRSVVPARTHHPLEPKACAKHEAHYGNSDWTERPENEMGCEMSGALSTPESGQWAPGSVLASGPVSAAEVQAVHGWVKRRRALRRRLCRARSAVVGTRPL